MSPLSSRSFLACLVLLCALCVPANSSASYVFGFTRITNNGLTNVASQLTVEVTNPTSGTVAFTFKNMGSTPSIVTDIYFEYDGLFVGNPSLSDSDGAATAVDFEVAKNPGTLPGGNGPPVNFDSALNLSRTSGDGVNSGLNNFNNIGDQEYLTSTFTLASGVSFADVITAVNEGDLRIGMHVQSIGTTGNSDGFINEADSQNSTTNVVPVPPAAFLLLSACPVLVWGYYRRQCGDTGRQQPV